MAAIPVASLVILLLVLVLHLTKGRYAAERKVLGSEQIGLLISNLLVWTALVAFPESCESIVARVSIYIIAIINVAWIFLAFLKRMARRPHHRQ